MILTEEQKETVLQYIINHGCGMRKCIDCAFTTPALHDYYLQNNPPMSKCPPVVTDDQYNINKRHEMFVGARTTSAFWRAFLERHKDQFTAEQITEVLL